MYFSYNYENESMVWPKYHFHFEVCEEACASSWYDCLDKYLDRMTEITFKLEMLMHCTPPPPRPPGIIIGESSLL